MQFAILSTYLSDKFALMRLISSMVEMRALMSLSQEDEYMGMESECQFMRIVPNLMFFSIWVRVCFSN